jgi:hypothetical protein
VKHPSGRRSSSVIALIVASILSLLAAGSVSASLFVILEPLAGPPGTDVSGQTGGERAFMSQLEPLPTYLVAAGAADAVASPEDPHLVQIGELVVDASGDGRISFQVPVVEPGNYVVMVFCPSCAATSAGRSMLAVAEFRVTPAPPSTDTPPSAELARPGMVEFGAIALSAAVALALLRRRWAR